tara:strand:- start:290 stop:817 length:528 start_codon:yes stop_codon:yes gene_type:complete
MKKIIATLLIFSISNEVISQDSKQMIPLKDFFMERNNRQLNKQDSSYLLIRCSALYMALSDQIYDKDMGDLDKNGINDPDEKELYNVSLVFLSSAIVLYKPEFTFEDLVREMGEFFENEEDVPEVVNRSLALMYDLSDEYNYLIYENFKLSGKPFNDYYKYDWSFCLEMYDKTKP